MRDPGPRARRRWGGWWRGQTCWDAPPVSGARAFRVGAPPASAPATLPPPARPPACGSQRPQEAFKHLEPETGVREAAGPLAHPSPARGPPGAQHHLSPPLPPPGNPAGAGATPLRPASDSRGGISGWCKQILEAAEEGGPAGAGIRGRHRQYPPSPPCTGRPHSLVLPGGGACRASPTLAAVGEPRPPPSPAALGPTQIQLLIPRRPGAHPGFTPLTCGAW